MSLSVQLMFKFPHHIVMSMAAVMAAFGIASITLAIVSLTYGVWGNYWGTGIWCGTVVFVGGLIGVVATHFRNSCCIKSYLILSIIGAVTSLAMLALSAGGLDYNSGFYKIQHGHSHNDFRTKVIYGCSLGCAIVQLVLCVASTGVCTYFIFIDKESVSFPIVTKQKNGHHKRNTGIRNSQTSINSRSPLVSKNIRSEAKNVRKSNRTCADIAENRNEVNLLSRGRHSQRRTSRRSNPSERNQSDVNDRSCGRPPTFSTFGHMPEDEDTRNGTNTAEVIASQPEESHNIQAQAPESSRINSLECLWEPTLPIEEDEELPPYEVSKAEDHCDLNAGSQPHCEDDELSSSSSESNISPLHRTHKYSGSQKAQTEVTHTDLNENSNKKHSNTCKIIDGRKTISGFEPDENIGHCGIHMPSPSSQGSKDAPRQLQRSLTLTSPYIHRHDKQAVPYNHDRQGVSYHGFKRDGVQIGFEESRKPPVRSQSLRLPLESRHHYFKVPSEHNLDKIVEVNARNSVPAQDIESLGATQGSWKISSCDPFPQKHSTKQALIEVPLHKSSFLTFKYSLPVKTDVSPKPSRLNPLSRCTDIIKCNLTQDVNLEELNIEQESEQSVKHHLPMNIVGKSLSQNTEKVYKQNTAELQGNKIEKDYNNCDNYYKAKETNKMGIFNKDKTKYIDETQDTKYQMDPSKSVINKESSQIQTKDSSKSDHIIHINSKQGVVKQVSLDQTLPKSSPLSPVLPSIPKACVTLPRHSNTSLFKPVHQHSHQEVISPIPTQIYFMPISVAQERKSDYGMSSTSQTLREPNASFADVDRALDTDVFEKDSSHQNLKQHSNMVHVGSKESRVQNKVSHPEKDQRPERIQSFQNLAYESSNVSPPSDSSALCSTSYSLEGTKDINDFPTAGLNSLLRESAGPHEVRNFNGARPKTSRITNSKDLPVLTQAGKSYFSRNKNTNQKDDVTENKQVLPQESLSAHIVIGRPLSREEFLSSPSRQRDLKVRLPVHCEGRISAPLSVVRQNSMPLDRPTEPKQNSGSSQFTTGVSNRFGTHVSAGAHNPTQGVRLLHRQQSYQESVNRHHENVGHDSSTHQAHAVVVGRVRQHPYQGPPHQQQPPPAQQHNGRQPLYSVLL
ncbi:hypothetical protein CHS0354_019466 [Potamilus streckersoni]|uniref:Uncharacterized protein n=1 Tax=Potamilus streckersoni TaxID=2493646 RepID=A0AAE0VVP1_9BIVA|nr:hypothetical protein CHS0354_019466 [Potamilus streckersoni]